MANFKRKRPRAKSVGCPCCHILNNNSASRTKPKDREIIERPARSRSKRPRTFVLEYNWRNRWLKTTSEWSVWKKYRTNDERARAMATLVRSHPYSTFRIPA